MMDRLFALWRKFRPPAADDFDSAPAADPEWRDILFTHILRLTAAFLILFLAVFFAFWWSGSAVRFGSLRVSGQARPTWRLTGVVRDAVTRQPIPWAAVEDDPSGRPPFFRAEADRFGAFELLTLAEPHRIRVSAPNYLPAVAPVGRAWFLWLPRGQEHRTFVLEPIAITPPR